MHSIFKSLLTIILPLTVTHHLTCSLNPQTHALTVFDKVPEVHKAILPEIFTYIISDFFPHSFNKSDKPKDIGDHIRNMNLVNKELNEFVNSRSTTQTIIDNLSNHKHQNYWAKTIAAPGMINYLKKSSPLFKHINHMRFNKINRLLAQGADINYSPTHKYPLLFKTLHSCTKTNYLLSHGANPNAMYYGKTALHRMIEQDNVPMAQVLLKYNPDDKCLPVAVFYQNRRIINAILQHKNIPLAHLNEALGVAVIKYDEETIKALLKAGAQLDGYYADMKKTLMNITGTNF